MVLKKYDRWPYAFVDKRGNVWHRSKTKGWFEFTFGEKGQPGSATHSKFMNHPDFYNCTKIESKKDFFKLYPAKLITNGTE